MNWLDRVFHRNRIYDDLGEEVREHIEERTEQLMRLQSLSRAEARQAALRAFGNPSLVETRSREVWQWSRLETLVADLKLAFRRLSRSPGFTATVLLTLAIGIGANTAVFSVVNSVLLEAASISRERSSRLTVAQCSGCGGIGEFPDRPAAFPLDVLCLQRKQSNLSIAWSVDEKQGERNRFGSAQEVNIVAVSDGVLQALDVPPLAGRELTAVDQVPNSAKNVVIGYGYWMRRFGGDPSAIGRTIIIDSQARTIVGVMPRGFRVVDQDFDILVPFALSATSSNWPVLADQGRSSQTWGDDCAGKRGYRANHSNLDGLILQRSRDRLALVHEMEDNAGLSFIEAGGHWQCWKCSVGCHGHHRAGAADCVHQRGQPAVGAG